MDLGKLSALAESVEAVVAEADPNRELHIDGDYCAYFYAGNDKTPLDTAWGVFTTRINQLAQQFGIGGRVILHLTFGGSDKGQRYKIATTLPYQGQRSHSDPPKNWAGMREKMESYIGEKIPGTNAIVKMWDDREADDGVAAAAHFAVSKGRKPYLYTRDKDFRMMPGYHITWDDWDIVEVKLDTWEVIHGGKMYGRKWFWHQMIEGDDVDNIPGLEGQLKKDGKSFKNCAAACARDLLADANNTAQAFAAVEKAYTIYYKEAAFDRMAEQAALLWMRTDKDASPFDFMKAFPASDGMALARNRLKLRISNDQDN